MITLFTSFLRWWIEELNAMTPAFLRSFTAPPRDGYVVEVDANELRLLRNARRQVTVLARVDISPSDVRPIDLERLVGVRSRDLGRAGVTLRIPAGAVLRTRMALPTAAEAELREVLSFEIDRLTPFKRTEVLFTHEILRRDTNTHKIDVELIVVPKVLVDRALAILGRVGIEPNAVEAARGDDRDLNGAAAQIQVLDDGKAGRVATSAAWSLAILAMLLSFLVLYLPLRQDRVIVDDLTTKMGEARKLVDDVVRLRAESLARDEDQARLRERKEGAYAAIELLEEVSRILPDHTHLTLWELNGGQLTLVGNSASASTVLSLIEESPMFERTSFRAPITQDPRLSRERFQISTQISPRPAR